jgi:hypothetical protein
VSFPKKLRNIGQFSTKLLFPKIPRNFVHGLFSKIPSNTISPNFAGALDEIYYPMKKKFHVFSKTIPLSFQRLSSMVNFLASV